MRVPGPLYSQLLADLLADGQPVLTRVHGRSMNPAIPDGAVVQLVPLACAPRVGEIVVRRLPEGGVICHRVALRLGGRFLTWGDTCWGPDGWARREELLGLAAAIEKDRQLQPLARRSVLRMWGRLGRWLLRRLLGQWPREAWEALCAPQGDEQDDA